MPRHSRVNRFLRPVILAILWLTTGGLSVPDPPSYSSSRYGSSIDAYRSPPSHDRAATHGGYRGYVGSASGSTGGEYVGRYGEETSQNGNDALKDSKYYYGGQYKGGCQADGLYYQDDTTFVMCSNGYPHQQPCPPGTKTSGSPSYKPGYYYGYTDLCSVNLVDYGLSPEYYAPVGYPAPASKDSYDGPTRGKEKQEVYSKQLTASFEKQSNGYGGSHQSFAQHAQKERGRNGATDIRTYEQKEYNNAAYPTVADSGFPAKAGSFISAGNHAIGYLPASGHHRGAGNSHREAYPNQNSHASYGGNSHAPRPIHASFVGTGSVSQNSGYSSSSHGTAPASPTRGGRITFSSQKAPASGGGLTHSGSQSSKYSAVYPSGGSGSSAASGATAHHSAGTDRSKYGQSGVYTDLSSVQQSGRAFHSH